MIQHPLIWEWFMIRTNWLQDGDIDKTTSINNFGRLWVLLGFEVPDSIVFAFHPWNHRNHLHLAFPKSGPSNIHTMVSMMIDSERQLVHLAGSMWEICILILRGMDRCSILSILQSSLNPRFSRYHSDFSSSIAHQSTHHITWCFHTRGPLIIQYSSVWGLLQCDIKLITIN